jgi:uncharacterized protein (DUF433 family)
MSANNYQHLEGRPGSNYQQLFVKGRRIRAEVLYRETIGEEPRTPEEVARDFDVPLQAVLESIDYCQKNEDLLRQERERGLQRIRALGLDQPPLVPPNFVPDA